MASLTLPDRGPAFEGPTGIGGWLLVPLAGFAMIAIGSILFVVAAVWGEGLGLVWSAAWLADVFGGGGRLAPLRAPTALTVAANAALVCSAWLCLFLVVKRRRVLIPVATAHYAIMAAAGLFEYWADRALAGLERSSSDAMTGRQALEAIAWSLVWGAYFHLSRRVRNTFVEPTGGAPLSAPHTHEPRRQ